VIEVRRLREKKRLAPVDRRRPVDVQDEVNESEFMIKVNTREAKTRLSELLAAVEKRGEVVILCRAGKPIAEISPLPRRCDPLRKDAKLSRIAFREDPAAPLHPEDWPDTAR